MFVFDLFEKKQPSKDQVASRFVGSFSQNKDAKAAMDMAMKVAPEASTPEEALAALANQQMELNKQQGDVLDQQTAVNQQQSQQINDLVTDVRRKEKDFRDLNAQIANMPNVTAQQAAKMAQDIEAAHDGDKTQRVSVPDVVAKRTQAPAQQPAAAKVAEPEPGANVVQIAQYQKAKDQGAEPVDTTPATQKPAPAAQPATEPTTSKALGQMATQLTPGRIIKGKATTTPAPAPTSTTNWAANQPTAQPKPTTGASNIKVFPGDQRRQQLSALGLGARKLGEALAPYDEEALYTHNEKAFSDGYAFSKPATLYFGQGRVEDLTFDEIDQMVKAIATDYTEQARPGVWQQLFTDYDFFEAFKKQHLSQMQLFKEGTVSPASSDRTTLLAYDDALKFLQYAYKQNADENMVRTMRQDFASKYAQRFAILPNPDQTYSMVDKQLSKRYRLPNPEFPLEEDSWHDGSNAWSSEHDQWAKESTDANIPKDVIQRYLAIDAEDDVAAVKAAIHAISNDPELKPTAKARLLGQVGMIIKTHRLPIGRAYYQFMQQFMEATDYQKRRQRERDIDAGKPVSRQPRNPQTDYQKKRARDRKEMELGESHMKDLFYKAQEDLKNLTDAQFIKTHGMSKVAFQQQYRTVLKPAPQQDIPVKESKNYWHQLQEERRRKAYSYLSELENVFKDVK